MNIGSAALLSAYRATTPEQRKWLLGMAQMCAERYPQAQVEPEPETFTELDILRLAEADMLKAGASRSAGPPGC